MMLLLLLLLLPVCVFFSPHLVCRGESLHLPLGPPVVVHLLQQRRPLLDGGMGLGPDDASTVVRSGGTVLELRGDLLQPLTNVSPPVGAGVNRNFLECHYLVYSGRRSLSQLNLSLTRPQFEVPGCLYIIRYSVFQYLEFSVS